MATVDQWLATLRKYKGVTENPAGSNKQPFAAKAGHLNGYAWCSTYLVACAREAGIKLPSESAYTPTMADGFRKAGQWYQTPQVGDIGFVDFPNDNKTRVQHVLVVTGIDGQNVRSIEGNTSSGNVGSQDNGGGVYERIRPRSWIVGYGRPSFTGAVAAQTQVSDQENEMGAVIQRKQGGYIVVAHDGGVFAYDGAPYFDSIPGLNQKKPGSVKLGGNVIGGAWSDSGNGYWLVASDGAVFAFGDALWKGGFNQLPPETRGRRYAIGIVRTGEASYKVITYGPDDTPSWRAYGFPV